MTDEKNHPYHILNPSPWPLVGSMAAFTLVIGTVLYMRKHGILVLNCGLGLFIITLLGWWRDVIKESKHEHTSTVQMGFRYGMALFIASEVMFFAAFFAAYFHAALDPSEAVGHIWPPKGIHTADPFDLPYINTLLLLLSGTTMTWAHHSLVMNDLKDMQHKLLMTIGLGLTFLGVQIYEYIHTSFAFKGGIYPSTFYMATGFHGFHVFAGTLFLIVCYFRARRHHFTAQDHFGFEAAAWYWHFVDVVWIFLFISIYWWGSAS